tara:strand:- start:956 stop:1441 length:486 start_codon:yes stop_codon:yes gene_type:complete
LIKGEKNMKKLIIIILSMPLFLNAADWGVGYTNFDIDLGDGDSASLGAVALTVGRTTEDGKFSGEFGIMIPAQDDTIDGVDVELEVAPYIRGMYNINENFFLSAGWMKLEAEACYQGYCESGSDTEGAIGLGVSFPSNNGQFRLIYEDVDDADVVSFKYNF